MCVRKYPREMSRPQRRKGEGSFSHFDDGTVILCFKTHTLKLLYLYLLLFWGFGPHLAMGPGGLYRWQRLNPSQLHAMKATYPLYYLSTSFTPMNE